MPDIYTLSPHHGPIGGAFAPGAAIANGATAYARIVLGPCQSARLRFLATIGGALTLAYVRPGQSWSIDPTLLAVYTANNPVGSPFVVGDAAESTIDITPGTGESELLISFAPTNDTVMQFFDLMLVP